MKILFLDFDGVLHPWVSHRDDHFFYLPRLEAVLRDYPEVKIVISSDWRFTHTLERLKTKFSPDIADRVIGQTPSLTRHTVNESGLRRREARAFLKANKLSRASWLALDDRMDLWEPIDRRIIICPDEFGAAEEARLRAALNVQQVR